MTNPQHPHWRVYEEGREARRQGLAHLANPYTGPRYNVHLKRAWSAGWLDQHGNITREMFGKKEKAA